MTRLDYNLKILSVLKDYLGQNPDMRFGQALSNLNIVKYKFIENTVTTRDPFYEESKDTFNELNLIKLQ